MATRMKFLSDGGCGGEVEVLMTVILFRFKRDGGETDEKVSIICSVKC